MNNIKVHAIKFIKTEPTEGDDRIYEVKLIDTDTNEIRVYKATTLCLENNNLFALPMAQAFWEIADKTPEKVYTYLEDDGE